MKMHNMESRKTVQDTGLVKLPKSCVFDAIKCFSRSLDILTSIRNLKKR